MAVELEKVEKFLNNEKFDEILEEFHNPKIFEKSSKEIMELLVNRIPIMPIMSIILRPYDIDKFNVYRVRYNINETDENIDLIRTYSYPNSSFCKDNGRANVSKHPIFYCSDDLPTAVAETKLDGPCTIYISKWIIRCHRSSKYAAFFFDEIMKTNPWTRIATNRKNDLINQIESQFGETARINFIKVLKLFSSMFVKDKFPYNFSSTMAYNAIYGEEHNCDYIIYPSARLESAHCNLAFHPNFVDEFFRIDKIYKAQVINTFEERVDLVLLGVGEYYNNQILWREPSELYDEEMKFFPKQI